MEIKFKRLSEKAVMPIRATEGSSGFDLVCTEITSEINECGQLVLVYHTGLAIEIPEGYEGQMRPRSSISKKSLRMCNAPGTIDSDYRGEITGKFISTTDVVPAVYKPGERFAQLIIAESKKDIKFVEAEELSNTDRGNGGYGSTGDKALSAPTGSESSPENKTEVTNSQTATEGSGGAANSPEKAE